MYMSTMISCFCPFCRPNIVAMHNYIVLEHYTSLVTLRLKLTSSFQDFCHPCNTAARLVFLHSEGNLLWSRPFLFCGD